MATSTFFDNVNDANEQSLMEDLIIESIQIHGKDLYYLPRRLINFDKMYETDDGSKYDTAYPIEMYLKSFDRFEGDGSIIEKLTGGLTINDQVVWSVARKRFEEDIAVNEEFNRPREGDIVYFPENRKSFVIRYVNKYEMFYPLGTLYTYELTCELFEYSGEEFSTGIAEIDAVQTRVSFNAFDHVLRTEDGAILTTEDGVPIVGETYNLERIDPLSDNQEIDEKVDSDDLIDWDEEDPYFEFGKVGDD